MNFLNNISNNIVWSPVDYAETAVVASECSDEMLARLEWMTIQPKVILDVGCGIGDSSLRLGERYPSAAVLALDMSLPMLRHARQETKLAACVCAEGGRLPLRNESVDLIFANFFLPWQRDIKSLLQEWRRVLTPNGLLMLSALGVDTLQECRSVLREEDTPVRVDVHDIGDALLQAGFSDPVLDVSHCQVTYRDQMRLTHDLTASGLWFPQNQADREMIKSLPPDAAGIWPVTYEIIYAHAFAPMASEEYAPAADGVVRIPLAQLRQRLRG